MTFSPRILENAMILYDEIKNHSAKFIRKALSTIIQPEKVESFIQFCEELKYINYKEVILGKKEKKDKVDQLVKEQKLDIISTIALDLADYIGTRGMTGEDMTFNDDGGRKESIEEEKGVKNITEFMLKLSPEIITVFIDALKDYDDDNSIVNHPYFRKRIKEEKLDEFKELYT